MSNTVIKVEDISKQYRLGTLSTKTLKKDLLRFWNNISKKKKLDESILNKIDDLGGEFVWALQNISFEVEQGNVVGIIGKNGAGKSTLLKIISRITAPTTGSIKAKGRIASLLEVGTGFHPELTGRENVFLNGSILGMKKAEIQLKFEEIVEFAGVQKYIDTPVKRYSSGMHVRLAFAVAAHLEPEILIVDEVLAVGDADFQKKAIGKMQDVSHGEGRTVLFVSHNIGSIKALCKKGIVLKNGTIDYIGDVNDAVANYLHANTQTGIDLALRIDRYGNGNLRFTGVEFLDKNTKNIDNVLTGGFLKIKMNFQMKNGIDLNKMIFGINFRDEYQNNIATFLSDEMHTEFKNESSCFLEIPKLMLRGGQYSLRLFASYKDRTADNICDSIENAITLTVISSDYWQIGKPIWNDKSALFDAKFYS